MRAFSPVALLSRPPTSIWHVISLLSCPTASFTSGPLNSLSVPHQAALALSRLHQELQESSAVPAEKPGRPGLFSSSGRSRPLSGAVPTTTSVVSAGRPSPQPPRPRSQQQRSSSAFVPVLLRALQAFVITGHHRDDVLLVIANRLVSGGVQQLTLVDTLQVAEGYAGMQVYDRRLFEELTQNMLRWPLQSGPGHAVRFLAALAAVRHRELAGGGRGTLGMLLESLHATSLSPSRLCQLGPADLTTLHRALVELKVVPPALMANVAAAAAAAGASR